MIIYISNEENKQMLNRIAEQYEWELLTEVMNKGSLNHFITEKLQVITNLQYLILDRSCISETDQQLNEVIETIQVMWDTKVILIVEELTNDEGDNQKVIYGEQIIFLYKYQDSIVEKLEYLLKGERIPEEEIYEGVWIGVMSANSGAGSTHVSIGLANYIKQRGESVCYVEANESGDLGAMAAFYEMEQIGESCYQKEGIGYWHQSVDPNQKFAVLDLGKYNGAKLNLFNQCRIKILITDGKPYRMADALNVLRYIGDNSTRLWMNFSSKEEYDRLRNEYLADINHVTGNVAWHRDMFQSEDVLYQETLREYINIIPVKQSKISFILNPDRLKGKKKCPTEVSMEFGQLSDQDENMKNTMTQMEEEETVYPEGETIQEEDFTEKDNIEYGQTADQEELEGVQEGKQTDKKKPVKSSLRLFIMISAVILGAVLSSAEIMQLPDGFHFNNPDAEQATELVDSDLNMNPEIKISVQEVDGADGYEVSYSTNKDFDKKTTVVVEVETADKAVESLTAGKTYYVRVRAFKFNGDGTKVYGEYTEVQEIET